MSLYVKPTGADQYLIIDEVTGQTVAVVYTTKQTAVMLSYADKMLKQIEGTRLHDEIMMEMIADD